MDARTEKKRILIMAAGTGGHIFPGLAVANYLRAAGHDVAWLGTPSGMENKIVPPANIPLLTVKIGGLRGKNLQTRILAPVKLIYAFFQSARLMRAFSPHLVIGMGGFVCGPAGLAAWIMRYPLIIHEQNAVAGLTNKLLAPLATFVIEGYPNAFAKRRNVVCLGNPVRPEISDLPAPAERFAERTSARRLRILVIGGSLGAQIFNKTIPAALQIIEHHRPDILHQTGEKNLAVTKDHYAEIRTGASIRLRSFIENMAKAYAWADIVICRAGALTVAELCAVGLGAIFVPYPHAVDDHQTSNANYMTAAKAAICLQQKELTAEKLASLIQALQANPANCLAMAEAAYRLRYESVLPKIAALCAESFK